MQIDTLARHVSRRYAIPGHTPADLHQEALAVMLEAQARGLGLTRETAGVLVRLAQRRLQALYKRSRREAGALRAAPLDRSPPVGSGIESDEELDRMLSLVTERQGLILLLGYRHGLSDDAIAATLGTSIGAVHVGRSKALATLRGRACTDGSLDDN